jgi:hypothetical protein
MTYGWSISALLTSKQVYSSARLWGIAAFSTTLWMMGTLDLCMNLYVTLKQLALEDGILLGVSPTVILEYVSVLEYCQKLSHTQFIFSRQIFTSSVCWEMLSWYDHRSSPLAAR